MRNSKIFIYGVFLSIYLRLLKKLELSKLCRNKVIRLKKIGKWLVQLKVTFNHQKRDIFFCSFCFDNSYWIHKFFWTNMYMIIKLINNYIYLELYWICFWHVIEFSSSISSSPQHFLKQITFSYVIFLTKIWFGEFN